VRSVGSVRSVGAVGSAVGAEGSWSAMSGTVRRGRLHVTGADRTTRQPGLRRGSPVPQRRGAAAAPCRGGAAAWPQQIPDVWVSRTPYGRSAHVEGRFLVAAHPGPGGRPRPGWPPTPAPGGRAPRAGRQNGSGVSVYFVSRYSWRASAPPSRPRPDSFTPPNGATPGRTRGSPG